MALSSTTNLANLLPIGVLLAFNLLALKSPYDGCVYYVVTSCTGLRLLNYLPGASPLSEGVTRRSPPQGTCTRHRIPIVANTVAKYKKSNREIDTNWLDLVQSIWPRRVQSDDSCISSPTSLTTTVISGIDVPLVNGSLSDNSGQKKERRLRRESGYAGAESSGESNDHGLGMMNIQVVVSVDSFS